MRERLWTIVSIIILLGVMGGLMVMAVSAMDIEAKALEQRTAAHVARMQ